MVERFSPPLRHSHVLLPTETQMLKSKIRIWNKEEFDNIFEDKKILISELDQLSQKGMTDGWDEDMQKKEKDLWGQLEGRERQEGIYWKQKSKVKWLQDGERNTKFFHNLVIQNRYSSRIQKVKKNGWYSD